LPARNKLARAAARTRGRPRPDTTGLVQQILQGPVSSLQGSDPRRRATILAVGVATSSGTTTTQPAPPRQAGWRWRAEAAAHLGCGPLGLRRASAHLTAAHLGRGSRSLAHQASLTLKPAD